MIVEAVRPEPAEESLFELADAIAALLDAPVTIEDRQSRVLAFSGLQDQADASRVATILGRQVPEPYHRILAERGVFRKVQHSDVPVLVAPVTTRPDEVAIPRVVASVRAGDEQLGSIWVAVHDSLSAPRMQALQDATTVVARHLLRARDRQGGAREAISAMVRTAVSGGPGGSEALHLLGLGGRSVAVAVLALAGPARGEREDDPAALAQQQRLTDAFAVHLAVSHPRARDSDGGRRRPWPGTRSGRRRRLAARRPSGWQATSWRGPPTGAGRRSAWAARRATSTGCSARAGWPSVPRRSWSRAGTSAERRGSPTYTSSPCYSTWPTRRRPGETCPTGPVARLLGYDAKNNTRLVDSLRAWLDAFGDVVTASAAVFVHPNTFRYRLSRIGEVSGLDLHDPDERFAAMLQLRMLATRSR